MELMIAKARQSIGEPLRFDFLEEVGQVEYGAGTLHFLTPLHVFGEVVFNGKSFQVSGTAETVFSSVCARCNEAFREPFRCSFSERFVKSAELDAEDDDYPYDGGALKLDDAVMDNIFLNLPLASVCSEGCKGLCPICGVNRNRQECSCKAEEKRNPFSVLETLEQMDKEV